MEKKFINFIKNHEIQAAIKLLKTKEGDSLKRKYNDTNTGNTYFHYIIESIINNINAYYADSEENELDYDLHIQLIEKLLKRNFFYDTNKKTLKLPHIRLEEYLNQNEKITDWDHITIVNRIHSLNYRES